MTTNGYNNKNSRTPDSFSMVRENFPRGHEFRPHALFHFQLNPSKQLIDRL